MPDIITPETTQQLLVTKYYITTPETAQGISAIKAMQQGCTGVTSFWWRIINHPTNGQSAIVFNPDMQSNSEEPLYENGSTVIHQADLVDRETLEANGWFPPLEN